MGDTLDEIICPACGKAMKKIFLDVQKFNVDICLDGCGGIYLDNREFKKLDEQHEDITQIEEALKGKTFAKVDESLTRVCPVCGHKMVKNYASHLKEVQIDECYNCGGKFFDLDELVKIRGQYKTEQERINAFNAYAQNLIDKMTPRESAVRTLGDAFNRIASYESEFKYK